MSSVQGFIYFLTFKKKTWIFFIAPPPPPFRSESIQALANSPSLTFWQIESGQADVDERDITGATPAHYAAAQGKRNNVLIN